MSQTGPTGSSYIVDESTAGKRLDLFVHENMSELSRASIQKLSTMDKISVNSKPAKSNQKLKAGDKVKVEFDPVDAAKTPKIDIPIIYEDDDCVVINKPVGVLTHSKGAFNPEATVATWLQPKLNGLDGERGGIVHRLDRATSGVMICAKTPEALSWLQKQFSQRKVKKTYVAIVAGRVEPDEAVIDMPIERNPKAPATFRVGANGKSAVTHYKLKKFSKSYSLVELMPETGRTHQLRVHLKKIDHPIVGDTLYGGEAADRLYLHAKSLEITLPNRERRIFEAKVPAEFAQKLSGAAK